MKIMGRMPTDDDEMEFLEVGGVMRNMWVAVSGVPDAYVRSWSDSELQDLVAPMLSQLFAAGRADLPRRVHIARSNEMRKSVWKTELPVVPDCVQLVNGVRDACALESTSSSTSTSLALPAPGTPAFVPASGTPGLAAALQSSARRSLSQSRSRQQQKAVASSSVGSADSWPPVSGWILRKTCHLMLLSGLHQRRLILGLIPSSRRCWVMIWWLPSTSLEVACSVILTLISRMHMMAMMVMKSPRRRRRKSGEELESIHKLW